jgi:probable HAF family extracellular repeat protein
MPCPLRRARILRGGLLAGLAVATVGLAPLSAGRSDIRIRELAPGRGEEQSFGHDVNARGLVIGVSMTVDAEGRPTRVRPVLWRDGRTVALALPEGRKWGWAVGVNNHGVIGGETGMDPSHSKEENPVDGHATLWKHGRPTLLASLAEGQPSYVSDVNDRGQAGGAAWNAEGHRRAAVWENARIIRVYAPLPGDTECTWYLSNAKNHGCGRSYTLDAEGRRTAPHAVFYKNGRTFALPVPEGFTASTAFSLNNRDQIVGYAVDADGHPHGMIWRNGKVQDLGIPPGATGSTADTINNKGEIVGTVSVSDTEFRTVRWTKKGARPLNQRFSRRGWTNVSPYVLNDRGQLCGGGTLHGEQRGFILTLPPAERGRE